MTKAQLQKIIDDGVSEALTRSRKAAHVTTKMAPADGQTRKLTLAERNAILSDPQLAVKAAAILNTVKAQPTPTAAQVAAHGGGVYGYLKAVRALENQGQ